MAEILRNNRVVRYLDVELWQEEQEQFRQDRRGRAGPDTRYKREIKKRWRMSWKLDKEVVDYDQKSDGMYPILTNDDTLSLSQVLEVHKRQPVIEKRFEQIKSIHDIAPVMLKNERRIEALFFIYFLAMMIQALNEREMRGAMESNKIEELAKYSEERTSKRPTSTQVLRLFSLAMGQLLIKDGEVVQIFAPQANGDPNTGVRAARNSADRLLVVLMDGSLGWLVYPLVPCQLIGSTSHSSSPNS